MLSFEWDAQKIDLRFPQICIRDQVDPTISQWSGNLQPCRQQFIDKVISPYKFHYLRIHVFSLYD